MEWAGWDVVGWDAADWVDRGSAAWAVLEEWVLLAAWAAWDSVEEAYFESLHLF